MHDEHNVRMHNPTWPVLLFFPANKTRSRAAFRKDSRYRFGQVAVSAFIYLGKKPYPRKWVLFSFPRVQYADFGDLFGAEEFVLVPVALNRVETLLFTDWDSASSKVGRQHV